jgi:hypothetical protein
MNWKLEIANLRSRAEAVYTSSPARVGFGAREVARILSGVAHTCARRFGTERMQRACAVLVLDERVWSSCLAVIPREEDGTIDPAIEMFVVIGRGVMGAASLDTLSSALSFWASESDPTVWQEIAQAA